MIKISKILKRNFSFEGISQTTSSLKETIGGLKEMNTIIEYTPEYSDEQKKNMKRFLIYRSNPGDPNDKPHYASYYIDLKKTNPMYLDALIKIKEESDPTLTFRRSCREGVCGSCSMNVDGQHRLACICEIDKDLSSPAIITPLGHMFVLKDLVVDMTNFYSQYRSIQPYLKRKNPKKENEKEYYQSEEDRAKLDGLYECVLCASCSTSCPSYWWFPDKYLGPAVLMQAYRWIVDSRDEFTDERLEFLSRDHKADECQNIGICTLTCPKDLNPQKSIQHLLKMIKEYDMRKADIDKL
jgi:succinate dehydrogenase (ubiquinone) iron-sulfur subunit